MAGKPPFYITTPIFYVNGPPHIGHAYTAIATDTIARFKRLDGYDVLFLTGTDEHGQKVEKTAQAAGQEPITFADHISGLFQAMGQTLNLSNDVTIRTTEPRHHTAVQAIWRELVARDQIYLDKYSGWYAVRDEAYYGEDELTLGPDGIRRAPSGAEAEWVEEPSYFFRLSQWQEPLLKLYEDNPDFVGPDSRRNEIISFVRQGLRDLSVSRTTFRWGVAVPDDPEHVVYVWLDALTNYLTALGYPDTESSSYKRYWPAHLHVMGKDISRFHAVYWPAFLMAAGLAVPHRIFAHGFLLNAGEKMSKSVGNVIGPDELVARYGLDPLRYYLLREISFGQDGVISHEGAVQRINADLANDLGNLAQRVLTQIHRNCNARVPATGDLHSADTALLAAAGSLPERVREAFDRLAIHRALETIWEVVGAANRYVDEMAPWALRKSDPERMATVLYTLAEVLRHLAIMVQPVMPESAGRLLDQLGVAPEIRDFAALAGQRLTPGAPLPAPAPLFPRLVDEAAEDA